MAEQKAHSPEHTRHAAKQAEHHLHHAEHHLHLARRLNLLSLIMLIIGVGSVAVGAHLIKTANDKAQTPVETNTVAVHAPQAKPFGQTLSTKAYELTLSNLRHDSVGDAVYKPANGDEFVVFTIKVKNSTASQLQFLPVLQAYLKDSAGKTYSMTPAPLTNPIQAGGVKGGDTISGQISFEVPKGKTDLNFYFDPGWPNSGGVGIMSLAN